MSASTVAVRPAHRDRSVQRGAIWRRWAVAMSLGELAGFMIPTATWSLAAAAVTGRSLVRLLDRPRQRPPGPLRRRARVRLNHGHAWIYARTGGRVGGRIGPCRVLLLTTTGRRTGRARRTPVQYQRIDGAPVVVAAAGGAPAPPGWWHNVEADPRVAVQIGAERWPARAVPLSGAEREAAWRRLCAANRHLAPLARRAGRELPVVRLERAPRD